MYPRILKTVANKSFFLFGPRGTGKSSWIKHLYGESASLIDLLDEQTYRFLISRPEKIKELINPNKKWVVIDEVQRIPEVLNEVHRLIESSQYLFILSGSSARKLKKVGANLLAGRALTNYMYPLTVAELGSDFILTKALTLGLLPTVWNFESIDENKKYLSSYVYTYLKEEIQHEGLTRNLGSFSRFLEIASFSQACPLNVSAVSREVGVDNKTAENYFTILEDLLLSHRLPVFSKHAKRAVYQQPKFLYFDVGVYRTIRPKGPLDTPELIDGASLETLFFQELHAINSYYDLGYQMYYWRTRSQHEIDFVIYGERGLIAFEIKRSASIRKEDISSLKLFKEDYPISKGIMLYGGTMRRYIDGIELIPYEEALRELHSLI